MNPRSTRSTTSSTDRRETPGDTAKTPLSSLSEISYSPEPSPLGWAVYSDLCASSSGVSAVLGVDVEMVVSVF
jgi:hypothetical protein